MSRRVFGVLECLTLLVGTPAAAQQAPASGSSNLTLATLEATAATRHPAILQAAARVDESRGRAAQSGAWSNPSIGLVSDELRPHESPSGFFGGFFQQAIPLGGKLAAARNEGEKEVARREADLETVKRRVLTTVRTRFYAVLAAQERVSTVEHLATLMAEAVDVTRQLFNVGAADQPDVLAAEVQRRRVAVELASARAMLDADWSRLGAAVADPALQPTPLAATFDTALPNLDRQASLDRLLRESPQLQEAAKALERAKASVTVATRLMRPDLFLRGEAGWNRERVDLTGASRIGWQFGVEASFSVPSFNKNSGGIRAANAAVTAAQGAADSLRLTLLDRFAAEFASYQTARAATESYKADILPRAQQAYELYLGKYRQMAAAYPQVLVAQRTLLELTGEYIDALDRVWRSALRIQGFLVDEDK